MECSGTLPLGVESEGQRAIVFLCFALMKIDQLNPALLTLFFTHFYP